MKETDQRSQACIPDSATNLQQHITKSSDARPQRPTPLAAFAPGDTLDMRGRLTSRRFVGRQPQLTEVQLAFREVCDQQPRMILLGGDSGIGKSRFLAEAETSFDGARVLLGQCVEQGDVELPYAPLLGALRRLARDRDPMLEELSPAGRAGLAPLLPSVGAAAGPAEPGFSGQIRLFESLLELLHVLSSQQPVVLILEDLHWADSSTRAFVAFWPEA